MGNGFQNCPVFDLHMEISDPAVYVIFSNSADSDSITVVFLWILRSALEDCFCKVLQCDCFYNFMGTESWWNKITRTISYYHTSIIFSKGHFLIDDIEEKSANYFFRTKHFFIIVAAIIQVRAGALQFSNKDFFSKCHQIHRKLQI